MPVLSNLLIPVDSGLQSDLGFTWPASSTGFSWPLLSSIPEVHHSGHPTPLQTIDQENLDPQPENDLNKKVNQAGRQGGTIHNAGVELNRKQQTYPASTNDTEEERTDTMELAVAGLAGWGIAGSRKLTQERTAIDCSGFAHLAKKENNRRFKTWPSTKRNIKNDRKKSFFFRTGSTHQHQHQQKQERP